MDINNIALIIVTAFVNLAVSNFIFYRYQKNIDLSFAKRLKEFEKELQVSVFKQQQQISINYPKSIEALQATVKKYQKFHDIASEVIVCVEQFHNRKDTDKTIEIENKIDELNLAMGDFNSSYNDVKLYVSENIANEILDIIQVVLFLTITLSRSLEFNILPSDVVKWINNGAKVSGANLPKLNPKNSNSISVYLRAITKEIRAKEEKLVLLYKSVVDMN